MSEFRGFRCDGCHKIIEDSSERTKQRVRFEGAGDTQDYYVDLCPDCADDAKRQAKNTMNPVAQRRRRSHRSPEAMDRAVA